MYSLGFRNLTDGALNYLWLNELLQVWPKEKLAQPMVCNLVARVPSNYRGVEGVEELLSQISVGPNHNPVFVSQ